jgi:hypothetical protein
MVRADRGVLHEVQPAAGPMPTESRDNVTRSE